MKRKFFILLCLTLVAGTTLAQPAKRRAETKETNTTKTAPKGVSYRDFPVAQTMPADVDWRRDVYRSIDLTKDENAVLYYPTTPTDGKMNLFHYIFRLLLRKQIHAYDTNLDASVDFSDGNQITALELMKGQKMHTYYEEKNGRIRVNDADIPSDEVKRYYVKESVYYDQNTATFHSKITALCPVLYRSDLDLDFGTATTTAGVPLFWVKFDELEPYLGKLMLMGSNYNNAAIMSADDYFTLHQYKGDIFRTVNLQDKLLSEYCATDSDIVKEQARIEQQLTDFEKHVWGSDSIAADTAKTDSIAEQPRRGLFARRRTSTSSATAKRRTTTARRSSAGRRTGSSSGATFSVRRERHLVEE